MDEARFREILHEELETQRQDIFRTLGDAVGYDLGDPDELKHIRKDLWMLRTTRQRSERWKATGERIFFIFFWGGVFSALGVGFWTIAKSKLGL